MIFLSLQSIEIFCAQIRKSPDTSNVNAFDFFIPKNIEIFYSLVYYRINDEFSLLLPAKSMHFLSYC